MLNPEAIVIVFVFAGLALIPASVARDKGRSFGVWWLYGLLFWIVALIHALLLSPEGEALDRKAVAAGNLKCPSCAEWIRRDAKVCRHCGRDVEPGLAKAGEEH